MPFIFSKNASTYMDNRFINFHKGSGEPSGVDAYIIEFWKRDGTLIDSDATVKESNVARAYTKEEKLFDKITDLSFNEEKLKIESPEKVEFPENPPEEPQLDIDDIKAMIITEDVNTAEPSSQKQRGRRAGK